MEPSAVTRPPRAASATPLDDDACYRALQARDARFDGSFFTGVTSTGIYCRPVCAVRTPRRPNCRFFAHAAQAEAAGFRPCLRCRPELAPQSLVWSIQDASAILAQQAARLLDEPATWAITPSIAGLAARLGVSDRHLRRIFEAQFGVTPLRWLQTRRLLAAKQLLADTDLPITRVAWASGFGSVRRFNAAFSAHYGLNPSTMRRTGAGTNPAGHAAARVGQPAGPRIAGGTDRDAVALRLSWRPPCDVEALLGFFGTRALRGCAYVDGLELGHTFALEMGGSRLQGWIVARFDPARHQVLLRVSAALAEALPVVIRRVRDAFDLDADPRAIAAVLHPCFPAGDGLRVPGALCGWELAARAVLGQQVSVAAARTLAQRLVDQLGTPLQTPVARLSALFPGPQVLADASGDLLGRLGIVRQRQAALHALADAVTCRRIVLDRSADLDSTVAALQALPGIGDWTAQYIAMRALRWPDAFPAGDVALHKALGIPPGRHAARAAHAASQAWRPWRSYAVVRAWHAAAG